MRKPVNKKVVVWGVSISVVAIGLALLICTMQLSKTVYVDNNITVEKEVERIVYKEPKGVIASITMTDLNKHLTTTYRHLSKVQRVIILTAIAKAADKYKISPIVFYGIIAVESSFRPWITHKQVVIKGKKDNAIGLGGIVSVWWLDKLRKAGILETKSDLYDPTININAIGFVLAEYKTMPLVKGTTNITTSALRRYFGGNKKKYTQEIENKIGAIIFSKIYEEE